MARTRPAGACAARLLLAHRTSLFRLLLPLALRLLLLLTLVLLAWLGLLASRRLLITGRERSNPAGQRRHDDDAESLFHDSHHKTIFHGRAITVVAVRS